MLLISRSQVRELLDWDSVLQGTSRGLRAEAADNALVATEVRYSRGALHLKSAAFGEGGVLTVKANLRPDAGNVSGLLLIYDLGKEDLAAAVDSGLFTALRTAAIATVAARALCRRPGVRMALLGFGKVGQLTLERVCETMEISEARVWTRRGPAATTAPSTTSSGTPVRMMSTAAEAVADADIVITCTPARQPLLEAKDLKDSAVVIAMGADSHGKRELGEGVLDGAFLVGDVPSECLKVGEFAYLGRPADVAIHSVGRILDGEQPISAEGSRVVFDSVGSSLVDAAVASILLDTAVAKGVGTPFDLQR